jgi:hypothetical protein
MEQPGNICVYSNWTLSDVRWYTRTCSVNFIQNGWDWGALSGLGKPPCQTLAIARTGCLSRPSSFFSWNSLWHAQLLCWRDQIGLGLDCQWNYKLPIGYPGFSNHCSSHNSLINSAVHCLTLFEIFVCPGQVGTDSVGDKLCSRLRHLASAGRAAAGLVPSQHAFILW